MLTKYEKNRHGASNDRARSAYISPQILESAIKNSGRSIAHYHDKLDLEEQLILDMHEAGEFAISDTRKSDLTQLKKQATEHVKKSARINIRLSPGDLEKIQRIAFDEGLPYQTLISSIIHKYIGATYRTRA